jgi:spore germination protein KB
MTNHVITDKQMQSIFIMFWIGSLVVSGINPQAKQDTWITILLAGIMMLPMIAMYIRITHLYPGLNLFEITFKIYGNIFGRMISFLFVVFAIHLGSLVIKVFTSFIKILNMPETPEMLTVTFIILFAVWSVKFGPENVGRVAKISWFAVALSVFITVVIAVKDMNFNNLKPIMETNFKTLLGASFTLCILPLGEMVLCFSFFSSISTKASTSKILVKSHVSLLALYLAAILRNVLVLGVPTALLVCYPSYACVSIISVGEFFTRIEVLTGLDLFLAGFIKVSVCLYASSLGLAKVLNISDQKFVVAPCALLMGTLSTMTFSNSVEIFEWIKIYQIYAPFFEIILPLILWIGAEIQTRINVANKESRKDSPC